MEVASIHHTTNNDHDILTFNVKMPEKISGSLQIQTPKGTGIIYSARYYPLVSFNTDELTEEVNFFKVSILQINEYDWIGMSGISPSLEKVEELVEREKWCLVFPISCFESRKLKNLPLGNISFDLYHNQLDKWFENPWGNPRLSKLTPKFKE